MMKRCFLIFSLMVLPWSAPAAKLKGKTLNNNKYPAELTLKDGSPVKGSVRFRAGKKAVFRAHDGTEVEIRVRPLCAHGPDARLDECWPSLSIEMDDLSSRTGTLKILGK